MSAITSLRLDVLDVPLRAPLETGGGRLTGRRIGLIRVAGSGGEEGLGEVALEEPGAPAIALPEGVAGAFVGLDPADVDALDPRLRVLEALPAIGRALRSAVETAAADLAARCAGVPLATSLVGRYLSSVAVNGLIGIVDADAAATAARRLVAEGYGTLKLKVRDEGTIALAARIGAVRDAVGPSVRLRVDANGAWPDVARALESLRALAPFGLEYAEQPLPVGLGPDAMARLRREAGVPIAADESVTDVDAARALLDTGAVDILVVKPARVGGVRRALRIAELAAAAGVPVVVSTLLETGIGLAAALHVAAALPNVAGRELAHGLATGGLLASDLLAGSLAIADGRLAVPASAGLGVTLDEAAVARFRTVGDPASASENATPATPGAPPAGA